jgi:hypothetical protein
VPDAVGVPLIVMILEAQVADTPAGKPDEVIPVAPVVLWVILGSTVLIHTVGLIEATLAVLAAVTTIVPVASTLPQPPVNGML